MRSCRALVVPILITALVLLAAPSARAAGTVRNVVIFIGDGMGDGQIATAAELAPPERPLVIPSAPVTGLMRTTADGAFVTDSAASGTALACGFKTTRGTVGQLPDGTQVENLMEAAHRNGLATGVVTTSGLVDATPATFSVHALRRDLYTRILRAQLTDPLDVMIGGDYAAYPRAAEARGYMEMVDGAAGLVPEGTVVVRSEEELAKASLDTRLVALLPPRETMKDQHGPPLAVTVRAALQRLAQNPRGFVLMAECEVTDSAGHDNDLGGVLAGVRELDAAVAVALEFARTHPGTLIVVTADHDTGGLGIIDGAGPEDVEVSWASHHHTAQWVPVFAWGSGAGTFTGVFQNSDLGPRIGGLLHVEGYPRRLPGGESAGR